MRPQTIVMGVVVCAMYVLALCALLFADPPQAARDALLVLIGGIGTAYSNVIAYFFGSSAGSAEKTELLRGRQYQDTQPAKDRP